MDKKRQDKLRRDKNEFLTITGSFLAIAVLKLGTTTLNNCLVEQDTCSLELR